MSRHVSCTYFSQWRLWLSGSVRSGDVCRNVFCGEVSGSALRLLRSHQHSWSGRFKAHTRELRRSSWTAFSLHGVTQGFSIVLVWPLVHVALNLCREVFSIPAPWKRKKDERPCLGRFNRWHLITSYHILLARLDPMTDREAGRGDVPPFSDPWGGEPMIYLSLTNSLPPALSCRRYIKWRMLEMVGSKLVTWFHVFDIFNHIFYSLLSLSHQFSLTTKQKVHAQKTLDTYMDIVLFCNSLYFSVAMTYP